MKDEHNVENYLMNIGYHRLSAYIHPFQSQKRFGTKGGTTFEQVLTLYRFDKKLRISFTEWMMKSTHTTGV